MLQLWLYSHSRKCVVEPAQLAAGEGRAEHLPAQPLVARRAADRQDTPLPFLLHGADPDTDPITYTNTTAPSHGVLAGTPPAMTDHPHNNVHGNDWFEFTTSETFWTAARPRSTSR